jgi:predicted small secreted protein
MAATTTSERADILTGREQNSGSAVICTDIIHILEIVMKNARITFLALLAAGALAACETVEGAGRDLQTVGESVTETSQEAQR